MTMASSSTPMASTERCCSGERMRMLTEKPQLPSMKLISSGGEFDEHGGFTNFLESVELPGHGSVVVAIFGPQSSGKSTLMNHLFGTNFQEMNAEDGRRATTKGIWLQRALESCTIVVDSEGTDGRRRRQQVDGQQQEENDRIFERQSAVFTLAIADVLIINMFCTSVGLDQTANMPLLEVVFEVAMSLGLFGTRKTTLYFVIRDKTKTPFDMLRSDLMDAVMEIWRTVPKPQGHEDTHLSQFFNVNVFAMSNYETTPDEFVEEVGRLRSRLFDWISPLTMPAEDGIRLSEAQRIWDMIKGCQDLHSLSSREIVATLRCEKIAKKKLRDFASDEEWLALQQAAASSLVPGFITRMISFLDKYVNEFDKESAPYNVNNVTGPIREDLISNVLREVRSAHMSTLGHGRSDALRRFGNQLIAALNEGRGFVESVETCKDSCVLRFDEQCGSDDERFSNDVAAVRGELLRDIGNHWHLVLENHWLPKIAEQHQFQNSPEFMTQLMNFPEVSTAGGNVWGDIRALVNQEIDAAAQALRLAAAGFELDEAAVSRMVDALRQSARQLVVTKIRNQTRDVPRLLTQRFNAALIPTELNQHPSDDDAYRECVKLLSTWAVIRLDEIEGDDHVESLLLSALMPAQDGILPDPHRLAYDAWEQVPAEMTLITPARCRDIWNPFRQTMGGHLAVARRFLNQCVTRRPPLWVITGLLTLGLGGVGGFMFAIRGEAQLVFTLASILLSMNIGELRNSYNDLQETVTGFCRRNRNILRAIEQALRRIYRRLQTFVVQNAIVVAA